MINNNIYFDREKTYELWKEKLNHNLILYVSCNTGWGKTVTAKHFAKKMYKNFVYVSAREEDFDSRIMDYLKYSHKRNVNSLIVIDDFQEVQSKSERDKFLSTLNTLGELSDKAGKISILILTRANLPEYMKPFSIVGRLAAVNEISLRLSEEEVNNILAKAGVDISVDSVKYIMDNTDGCYLIFKMFLKYITEGLDVITSYSYLREDLYAYIDHSMFNQWNKNIQHFLLRMAFFHDFTYKMCNYINASDDVKGIINTLNSQCSVLTFCPPDKYTIIPLFKNYLEKKQKDVLTLEDANRCLENGGLYYEQMGDIPSALSCYGRANNSNKVAELLQLLVEKYGGSLYVREVRQYYSYLDDEMIKESPKLISAMAMFKSCQLQVEESEKYIAMLEDMVSQLPKKDDRYKEALEKLYYLYISIPHRGVSKLVKLIPHITSICGQKDLNLQMMSATGNQPSIMNGGKDFSMWSRHDKFLYKMLKKTVEQMLGKNGVGIPETGVGESLYYKNKTIEAMSYLTQGLSNANLNGDIQVQFAATGIMAKVFIAGGSIDTAFNIVENIEKKAVINSEIQILENLHALKAYICLYNGNNNYISMWMDSIKQMPLSDFYITDRYILIVKARCYLKSGQDMEAYAILKIIERYIKLYKRPFMYMECLLLQAIFHYRNNGEWKPIFLEVLKKAQGYNFIRLIADEGVAVGQFFEKNVLNEDDLKNAGIKESFFNSVQEAVGIQSMYYPQYLINYKQKVSLSKQEMEVLRCMALGMSQKDIGEKLDIKVATVKFHTKNIYTKFETKDKSQVLMLARGNKLI